MADGVKVAKRLISICKENNVSFNHTKIQKLLYAAHGACLVVNDYALIDESPKLWPYGPVFPKILKETKKGIDQLSCEDSNSCYEDVLQETVRSFGKYSASILSDWSHKEGSPWKQMVDNGDKWNTPMPNDVIKSYFDSEVITKE